jgi:multiple sugar transport system substrate-binding protein
MESRAFKQAACTWPKRSGPRRLFGSAAIGALLTIAAIGPARLPGSVARAASTTATTTCAGSDTASGTTISIAYSSTQEFNVNAQAAQWFAMLKKQFEAAHPGVTVKLIPIGGSYNDFVTKTNLMLRSPSTTPDVIHESTQLVSGQVEAQQLAPIDDCVAAWPDWKLFPTAVKYSGTPGPHFWQLTSGINNFGLYYDVNYFKQAGLPTTWQPHTWADILTAARAIQSHVKNVTPLWLYAGNQVYDQTTRENFLDLLAGTRSPVTVGAKWVVKSSGLLDTFNFYNTVFSQGLGPSASDLDNPSADGLLTGTLMPKQKVAIALVGSWAGSWWTPGGAAPWSGAINAYKAAALPTEFGQAPGYVSQEQGSNFVLTNASTHKKLAFELMAMAEDHQFNLLHTEWTGEVPPRTDVAQDPKWLASTPYYNQQAAAWVKYGTFTPAINYSTIATAVGQSTGEILASHISGQQALDEFTRRVSQVLDPSAVTTAK